MHSFRSSLTRRLALGVLASLLVASVPGTARASTPPALASAHVAGGVPEVTDAEISASNQKISQAYQALVAMWSERFAKLGARFAAPGLEAYRGNARTGCGIMHSDNAAYCAARNAIYFDESFLARLAGAAS